MKIIKSNNYESMSLAVADELFTLYRQNPQSNCCLATGSSPRRAYEILVERILEAKLDVSNLSFTKLDEWCGLPMEHSATCEYFIQEYMVRPLQIKSENYITFDPYTHEVTQEIQRVNKTLEAKPLDIVILGLGKNGHLGLNEPSDYLHKDMHEVHIDEKTKTHDMIKTCNVTSGVTLGLAQLFQAKHIIFIVSGSEKEAAYATFMNKQIDTHLPASLLWLHPNVTMFVDTSVFRE